MRFLCQRVPSRRTAAGLIFPNEKRAERESAPPLFCKKPKGGEDILDIPSLQKGEKLEPLSKNVSVITGNGYTFSTDTILLAWFSMPKRGETCADFGTGCGAIPLLWCTRAQPHRVYAVEIQPEACDMARRSAEYNGLQDAVHIAECDIREAHGKAGLPYNLDLVACNPPYKVAGSGVVSAAAGDRIARHETVCSFAEIAVAAAGSLRWGGRFCCCMRPERLYGILADLHEAGLEPKQLRFVQQREGAAPFLFLLRANRGGKPGIRVEPVLMIENSRGSLSEEMQNIYGDYKEGKV